MPISMENPQVVVKDETILGKTLLWMCYGLLLTFGAAFLIPYLISLGFGSNALANETFGTILYVMCGVGGLGVLVMSMVMMFKSFSIKGFGVVLFSIYSLFMGLALSPLWLLAQDAQGALGLLYTFLVTGGIFAIMGVIGILSKGRIRGFALAASGLLIGTLVMSLVNMFFFNEMVYWLVSFGIMAVFMLYTVIDFARISRMPNFEGSNLPIMCAYTLYTDFIVLFIRILPIVLSLVSRNDN